MLPETNEILKPFLEQVSKEHRDQAKQDLVETCSAIVNGDILDGDLVNLRYLSKRV